MDNVTRQSTEASAEASLSPDQWQALGRMADNYRKLEEAGKFVTTNFGGDLTARTLELAELAQDPQLGHSLNELLQTLNLLAESGMLERLRRFVAFASETEGNLDADQLMSEALHGADAIPFGKFVKAVRNIDSKADRQLASGGWGGLLRIMRDPDVQLGLVTLSRLAASLKTEGKRAG